MTRTHARKGDPTVAAFTTRCTHFAAASELCFYEARNATAEAAWRDVRGENEGAERASLVENS